MKKHLCLKTWLGAVLLWMVTLSVAAQDAERIRVACVGNSITYGAYIDHRMANGYPAYLQQFLGTGYDVRNFGENGRTMLTTADYPYVESPRYAEALAFNPDIVVLKLGTNDTKPHNWTNRKAFERDMTDLIHSFQALPAHPQVYVCLPVPAYLLKEGITGSVLTKQVIPSLLKVAKREGLPVIDLQNGLMPWYPALFPDNCHPNAQGAAVMAGIVSKAISGQEPPQAHDAGQPFPGRVSEWAGGTRYDFVYDGRACIVVRPEHPAPGNPWIWRPAFFNAFPSVDKALLARGWHIVYNDLTHLYGSPRSIELGNRFWQLMQECGLSPKVVVEGLSRGGYFAFNWAAANPDKVSCLYVDAPVCDITSWPGRKAPDLWDGFLKEWGVSDDEVDSTFRGNALQQLPALAAAGIPIIGCCGDSDVTVPYEDNFRPVRDAYEALGGVVETIVKPGCDHHPHSLDDPTPIVDFITRYLPGQQEERHICHRGTVTNAFTKFVQEQKGCVAFLGGSITEMKGWREMIEEDLRQRFPHTDFQFIDAGIASLGSTPHAFRFANDVLAQGVPDLLFVEAAVNDATNGFSRDLQIKSMEGIVRHALTANPLMDIVMMHFEYDDFLPLYAAGKVPEVITNHEAVAEHYGITSIHLADEIARRIAKGELTWETFGGVHPAPLGHTYYAAAIADVFDRSSRLLGTPAVPQPHALPEPLDAASFACGEQMSVTAAKRLRGFTLDEDWCPNDGVGTRSQFVHIPVLCADKAGASLKLTFEGTAIGIFCEAGPQTGMVSYTIDDGPQRTLDTFTQWSGGLYLPFIYMLDSDLAPGRHTLKLKVKDGDRTGLRIVYFAVNGI